MLPDIKYATRLLRKNPGFTAVAVFTLAIGIGANTAIFSITDAVLLRPLPYRDANRLVRIWQSEPKMGEAHLGTAPPEFAAYRDRTRAFESLAGYYRDSFDVTSDTAPEHIAICRATASLFGTLGIQPMMGRVFSVKEEAPASGRVVVLSYQFWRHHFGEDSHVVGKMIRLNERPYEVIGVMPPAFTFPSTAATPSEPPALWVPLWFTADQLKDWASSFDTSIVARLRPDATLAQARDDVKRVVAEFQNEQSTIYSGNIVLEATAEPWVPDFGPRTRVMLTMLMAVVGFVLLIACANIANLFLVRAGARQREMSIRRALGASDFRLTLQILTETAMVAIGGGAFGCALAYALLEWINTVSTKEVNIAAAAIDVRVLGYTLLLCGVTCLLCGIVPAWSFRFQGLHDGLKQSARQVGSSRMGRRIARALVVTEVACCVVLLIGSGLLVRSFVQLLRVPLGFEPGHTLIVRTMLNRQRYAAAQRYAVERAIEAKLAAVAGVSSTAVTTHVPLADERTIGFLIDGAAPNDFHWANNALVSGNFFQVMRIPLLQGRTFSDADTPQSPLTAVINETMAKQYFPRQGPIGKGFKWGGRHIFVIGVVGDVHVEGMDKPVAPTIYNSVYQLESGASTSGVFVMRTAQDPMHLASAAQDVIWSVDRGLPILGFSTLEQVVSQSLATRRLSVALVGSFAFIALLLSLIGVYGVLSYAVTQRVQEMGVRLALGARPDQIKGLVIGDGMRMTLTGIVLGVAGGMIVTRYISNLLFGVRALDTASFGLGVLLLFGVGLLASYLPARRAGRVDPMSALRNE